MTTYAGLGLKMVADSAATKPYGAIVAGCVVGAGMKIAAFSFDA